MLSTFIASLFCFGCSGMPDWPADGLASQDWVEEALEWRLRRGVDDCAGEMLALDALSLEWIANSAEIQVKIETQDWPFLAVAPELTAPLIQLHAWRLIRGEELDAQEVHKVMKRIARKSPTLRFREIRGTFK
jgi:hypothetical protein|tara:strand:+ start:147 stop:545 length:399 start_codon:yes stop_codon:yes gene_type:complete